MKKPSKALNTGQLSDWQKENRKELRNEFQEINGDHYIDLHFLQWLYNSLIDNQTHVTQPLKLKHLIHCDKDGNPLEKPKDYGDMYAHINEAIFKDNKKFQEYQQAEKQILFEGWRIERMYKDTRDDAFMVLKGKKCIYFFKNQKGESKTDTFKSIEQLITEIPDIKITSNYYNFLK